MAAKSVLDFDQWGQASIEAGLRTAALYSVSVRSASRAKPLAHRRTNQLEWQIQVDLLGRDRSQVGFPAFGVKQHRISFFQLGFRPTEFDRVPDQRETEVLRNPGSGAHEMQVSSSRTFSARGYL